MIFADPNNHIGIDTNVNRVYCLHKHFYKNYKIIIKILKEVTIT